VLNLNSMDKSMQTILWDDLSAYYAMLLL